jgi:hypothetical protein
MGCDIHTTIECQTPSGRWESVPHFELFDFRNYNLFAWLAGVRNYTDIQPIAEPRGLPDDVSDQVRAQVEAWGSDGHSVSWLSLKELTGFDYDAACQPPSPDALTYREFLGDAYFAELDRLRLLGEQAATRIVFWFDN